MALLSKKQVYKELGIGRVALSRLRDLGLVKWRVVDGRGTRKYTEKSIKEFKGE